MDSQLSCAKHLYFMNFGSFITMKRNGEFEKYLQYKISKEMELDWSREIQSDIVLEIKQGRNLWKIDALSKINLPQNELLAAFCELSVCSQKEAIAEMLFKLEPLIDSELFKKVKLLFRTGDDPKPMKK